MIALLQRWFPRRASLKDPPLLGDIMDTRDQLADLMIRLDAFDKLLQRFIDNPKEGPQGDQGEQQPGG